MEDTVLDAVRGARTEFEVEAIIDAFHHCLEGQVGLDIEFDKVVMATKRTLLFGQVGFPPHVADLILARRARAR